MTTKELSRAMERITGSPFIKIGEISKMVGDTKTTRVKKTYLEGLESFNGRYFIPEVAERIKEKMTV